MQRVNSLAAQESQLGSFALTLGRLARGYALAIREMNLKPMLLLEMRLGEGSGCPIAFEIIDSALSVLRNMATFEEARIDDDYLAEIRAERRFQR